jgi:hypothetical protein
MAIKFAPDPVGDLARMHARLADKARPVLDSDTEEPCSAAALREMVRRAEQQNFFQV